MEEFNMQDNMDKATGALLDASQRELKFTQKVNVNGFNKTGTFVAGIPTIAQRIQIGVIRARMLGGMLCIFSLKGIHPVGHLSKHFT